MLNAIDVIYRPTGQIMTVFLSLQERLGHVSPDHQVVAYLDNQGQIVPTCVKLSDLDLTEEDEPVTRPDWKPRK